MRYCKLRDGHCLTSSTPLPLQLVVALYFFFFFQSVEPSFLSTCNAGLRGYVTMRIHFSLSNWEKFNSAAAQVCSSEIYHPSLLKPPLPRLVLTTDSPAGILGQVSFQHKLDKHDTLLLGHLGSRTLSGLAKLSLDLHCSLRPFHLELFPSPQDLICIIV